MIKYIILFLLWGVFGNAQYNLFARQNFAKSASVPTFNTYIGGVSGTIATASALATKLGISVGAISNFTVAGSDIKCKITGSYAMNSWSNNTAITYIKDADNLVTNTPQFDNCTNISGVVEFITPTTNGVSYLVTNSNIDAILLPNVTSVYTHAFFENTSKIRDYYIPRCTALGTTSGDNSVFVGINPGSKIYVPTSLATNNGGNPDGDLQYAIGRGAIVRYVANFTLPNTPVFSAGGIYNTAIQIVNTASASTNTIDFYNVYNNGNYIGKSKDGYIIGLTASTSYNLSIEAVDIYHNVSPKSNAISVSTNTTSYLEFRTIAAYDLATNGNDAKGSYNGTTGSGTTYTSSEATFNGTSNAYVSVADNDAFSFGDGTTDQPFSISFYIQFANKATTAGYAPISKSNNANNINDEYCMVIYSNVIYWKLMDDNTIGSHIGLQYNMASLSNNTYYHFTLTYDGSKTYGGIKFYINGVLTPTTSFPSGTYTGMNNGTFPFKIGNDNSNSFGLNGKMKNVYIFNSELTQTEITYLQTHNYPF